MRMKCMKELTQNTQVCLFGLFVCLDLFGFGWIEILFACLFVCLVEVCLINNTGYG